MELTPEQQEAAALAAAQEKEAADLAAANQGNKPKAPKAAKTPKPRWSLGDVVEVTATHGPLHHLHTGEVFGAAPAAVEIDAFILLQLEAGKLTEVSPT